jgi:hypothetical protein
MKKEAISNLTMNLMESLIWLRMNAGGMLNTCKSDGKHPSGALSGGWANLCTNQSSVNPKPIKVQAN